MSSSKIKKELQAASLNNKLEQMGQNIAKAIEDLFNPQAKQQSTHSASHEEMFEDSFPLPVFAPPASKGIEPLMSQGSTMPIHREYFGQATAHFEDTLAFLGLDNTLFKGFDVFDLTTGFIERKENTKGFEILSEKELGNSESLRYEFPISFQDFLPKHAPVLAQPNAHVLDIAHIAPVLDPNSADIDAELDNDMAGIFDDLFADINSASNDDDIHLEENEVIDIGFDPLLHARANLDDAQEPGVDANPQPPIDDVLNMFGGGHRGGFKVNKPVQEILEQKQPAFTFDALYDALDPAELIDEPTTHENAATHELQTIDLREQLREPTVHEEEIQIIDLREQLGEPTVYEEEVTHSNSNTVHSSTESDLSSLDIDFNDLYEEFSASKESTHSSTSSDDLFGDLFETTSHTSKTIETTSSFVFDDLFADIQRPPVPELNDLFSTPNHERIAEEEMHELFGSTDGSSLRASSNITDTQQLIDDTFEEFDRIVATIPKTSTKAKASTSLLESDLGEDADELSRLKLKPTIHADLSEEQVDPHTFDKPELRHIEPTPVSDDTHLDISESSSDTSRNISPSSTRDNEEILTIFDEIEPSEISSLRTAEQSELQYSAKAPVKFLSSTSDSSGELFTDVTLRSVPHSNNTETQTNGTFIRPELRHIEPISVSDTITFTEEETARIAEGFNGILNSATTKQQLIDDMFGEFDPIAATIPQTNAKVKASTSLPESDLGEDADELSHVKRRPVTQSNSSTEQISGHTFEIPELSPVSTETLNDSTEHLNVDFSILYPTHTDSRSSADTDVLDDLTFNPLYENISSNNTSKTSSMPSPINVHGLLLALEKMNAEQERTSTSSTLQSPIEEDMPLLPSVMLSPEDLHAHELSYIKEQLAGEKRSYQSGIHAIHQNLMQFNSVKLEMTTYLKLQASDLDKQSAEYKNIAELIALWDKIDTREVLGYLNESIKVVNTNGANQMYSALQQVMAEAVEKTNAYIEQVMLDVSRNKVQFSAENNPLISLQTWFEKASTIIESGIKQAEQYKTLIGEKLRVVEKLRIEDVVKKIFYGSTLSTEDVLSSKPKSSALESAENQFQIKSNTFVEKQAQQSKAEIKVEKAHANYLEQTQAVADKLEKALPYKKPDTWGDWAKVILTQPATLAHSILSKNEPLDAHQQEIQLLKESMQKAQQQFDFAKQDFNAQISSIAKEFHVTDNSKTVIDWLTMKAEHPDTLAQQQKCIGYLQDLDHKAEIANLWKDVADQADTALQAIDTYLEQIDILKLANSALVDAYGEYKMAENHLEAVKQQEAELADQLERQFASEDHTSLGSSKAAKDIDASSSHMTNDNAENALDGLTFAHLFKSSDDDTVQEDVNARLTGLNFDLLFTRAETSTESDNNSELTVDFSVLFSGSTYTPPMDDPLLLSSSLDSL